MNFINELRLLRRTIEMYNSIVGNCQVIAKSRTVPELWNGWQVYRGGFSEGSTGVVRAPHPPFFFQKEPSFFS